MDTPFSHKAMGEGGRGLRAAGRKRQERTFSHNVDLKRRGDVAGAVAPVLQEVCYVV
jgi:hypothetical protein